VFAGNVDKAVNGPLWSLYLEVRLYVCAAYSVVDVPRPPPANGHRGDRRDAIAGMAAGPKWLSVFGESTKPHHLLDFIHAGRLWRTVERQSTPSATYG